LLSCNGRVARLTEPAQVAPDQPQVRPFRDRDDVVDLPRSHDQLAFQAQTAEWFLRKYDPSQPAPSRIVSPLGRATTLLFRLPIVYRAAAIGHGERPAAGRCARFGWCHWHLINDLPSGRTSAALRSECRSSKLRSRRGEAGMVKEQNPTSEQPRESNFRVAFHRQKIAGRSAPSFPVTRPNGTEEIQSNGRVRITFCRWRSKTWHVTAPNRPQSFVRGWLVPGLYFFNSACQFSTTVMDAAVDPPP
jgi:hypothetical protein